MAGARVRAGRPLQETVGIIKAGGVGGLTRGSSERPEIEIYSDEASGLCKWIACGGKGEERSKSTPGFVV